MTDQGITLGIILEHIQGLRSDLTQRMDQIKVEINHLNAKVDRYHGNVSNQIRNIDKRLDEVEITILDQKHERRITRLEAHAGLRK